MECKCHAKLSNVQKQVEVLRLIDTVEPVDQSASIIIIYSKLGNDNLICINTVIFKIKPGINKICICNLKQKNLSSRLRISCNLLSKLERIKTKNIGVEIYVLKGKEHENTCINSQVKSLIELSYFQIFLNGIGKNGLEKLVKEGKLPKTVFDQRLKGTNHIGFFNFSDLFHLRFPTIVNKIASCKRPSQHLNINFFNENELIN